jgi:hypothetical protein
MKTAMQELIEWYYKEHFVKTTFHIQLLNKFEKLLEKEKEQIIQARIDGDENYSLIGGKRYEYAEQYYNETYNQNER